MIIAGVLLPCVPAVINVAFGYGIVTFSPVRCEVAVQDVGFYTEALAEGFEVAILGTLQALVIMKLMKVGITTAKYTGVLCFMYPPPPSPPTYIIIACCKEEKGRK